MKPKIDLIGIITSQFDAMHDFYRDVLEFKVMLKMDNFVEFENDGVRFALSTNKVMAQATGDSTYMDAKNGHSLELAFRADSLEDVDMSYKKVVEQGATPVKGPENMPWGQRTAFFADPDGNIHEIFFDIPKSN